MKTPPNNPKQKKTALPTPTRPSLLLLGTEPWRAAMEYLANRLNPLPANERGDGHPVVLFPGLGSGPAAMEPMSRHCQALGYAPLDWGWGTNRGPRGDVHAWFAQLGEHVAALLDQHAQARQTATLVGWSLGGLYAREVAKLLGPRVRQVITVGSPFNAWADHTNVGWLYRLLNGSPARLDRALAARLRTPPRVPTTSIYSRSDGIVAWPTCCHDRPEPHVQDVEIKSSHTGMGWNPLALRVIADRLAQRPGRWQPYRMPEAGAPSRLHAVPAKA